MASDYKSRINKNDVYASIMLFFTLKILSARIEIGCLVYIQSCLLASVTSL